MKKVIFLHIPKTAGQSVHQFLIDSFGVENVCPARTNEQIDDYPIEALNKYQIISGHIDWSVIEKLDGEKYIFSILRDPKDRILSFYHYLRGRARKMSAIELKQPNRAGMNAALHMTPDEYFCGGDREIRTFIDNHYDNFYTYFLATKTYNGRSTFLKENNDRDSTKKIFSSALKNLLQLDNIYLLSNWMKLKNDLSSIFPDKVFKEKNYHINKGDGLNSEERIIKLRSLGATDKTIKKIDKMCFLDKHLYDIVKVLNFERRQIN
jgi:hypothetical protein